VLTAGFQPVAKLRANSCQISTFCPLHFLYGEQLFWRITAGAQELVHARGGQKGGGQPVNYSAEPISTGRSD